jgi:hypothetical protein
MWDHQKQGPHYLGRLLNSDAKQFMTFLCDGDGNVSDDIIYER